MHIFFLSGHILEVQYFLKSYRHDANMNSLRLRFSDLFETMFNPWRGPLCQLFFLLSQVFLKNGYINGWNCQEYFVVYNVTTYLSEDGQIKVGERRKYSKNLINFFKYMWVLVMIILRRKKNFGHFSQKRQTDRRQTDLFNCICIMSLV